METDTKVSYSLVRADALNVGDIVSQKGTPLEVVALVGYPGEWLEITLAPWAGEEVTIVADGPGELFTRINW